jgi:hypothetical protein
MAVKFQLMVADCILRNVSYCIVDDFFYVWDGKKERWILWMG